MVAVMTSPPAALASAPDEGQHAALLRDDTAFTAVPDADLDRWIAAVRRQTNVACAAHGARQVVRVIGKSAGSPKRLNELTSSVSLEDYLLGPTATAAGETPGVFAELPIMLSGHVIGPIGHYRSDAQRLVARGSGDSP